MPDRGTYPTPLAAQLGANLQRELREALDDRDFLEDGGLLGVPCMHLYEQVCVCVWVTRPSVCTGCFVR